MSKLITPDRPQLEQWLERLGVPHDLCPHCEGLHLLPLLEEEGVIDCRLFVERYGLSLLTELEIRPMAVLPLTVEIHRLNMDFPTLKLFIDIGDEIGPQLVALSIQLTGAGLSFEQFSHFVAMTLEETSQLARSCLQLDYLYAEPDEAEEGENTPHALH